MFLKYCMVDNINIKLVLIVVRMCWLMFFCDCGYKIILYKNCSFEFYFFLWVGLKFKCLDCI